MSIPPIGVRPTEYNTQEIQEYNLNRQREEAKQLKPVSTSIIPPAGYYISPADQQKYKQEAMAYNKKLSQYKQDLNAAWRQVQENKRTLSSYITQRNQIIKNIQATAPDRKAFLKYIQSVGPPEPTKAEKARQEAGMPMVGLPGPGARPKAGSAGETLQKGTQRGFEIAEVPFLAVTSPVREASEYLRKLSLDASRTERALQPKTQFGTETPFSMEQPVMVPSKARPEVGFGAYVGSVGLDVVAAGVDVATFSYRPGLVVGTVKALAKPETYTELAKSAVQDPFRFASVLVGGSWVGGSIQRFTAKELRTAWKVLEAQKGSTTKGVYGASVKKSSYKDFLKEYKIAKKASGNAQAFDETFSTQFERELGMDFPDETMPVIDYQLFDQKTLKFKTEYKPGKFVDAEAKYYGKVDTTDPQIAAIDEIVRQMMVDEVDPWSPTKVAGGDTGLPYNIGEEGGFVVTTGRTGKMKPFKEPALPPVPRNDQMLAPLSIKPGKVAKSTGKLAAKSEGLFYAPGETVTSYISAADLRSPLYTIPPVNVPSVFSLGLTSIIAPVTRLASLPSQTQSQRNALKQIERDILKTPQVPKFADFTVPIFGVTSTQKMKQAQKPSQVQVPMSILMQVPVVVQIQTPRQAEIQIPKMDQIVIPMPIVPPFIPTRFTTPKEPKIRFPLEPTKKTKKKKKKKTGKKAYERRVDPLSIIIPSVKFNVKVPKF